MAEVRVIARSVARKGREDQLGALLQGMLDVSTSAKSDSAPTHLAPGPREAAAL